MAYLVYIVASPAPWPEDFRYIWRAGNLWARGIDPYGPSFAAMNTQHPASERMSGWVYPPHWIGLATPFGVLTQPLAFALWKAASTILFVVGSVAAWRKLALPERLGPIACVWMLAYALTMTGVGGMLRTGQPAIVPYIGLCIVVVAIAQERRAFLAVGLMIAMSKPQVGMPFACLLLFDRPSRPSVFVAAVLTMLASLPAIYLSGPGGGVLAMLQDGGAEYQAVSVNTAYSMSGIFHAVARATGWEMSIMGSTIAASVIAAAIGALLLRRDNCLSRPATLETIMITGVCAIIVITLLHGHDLTIALLLLPLLARLDRPGLALAGAGFFLLWRPENLLRPIGLDSAWADLTSLAIALIATAFGRRLSLIRGGGGAGRLNESVASTLQLPRQ